jgi:hypothetical protein
MFSTAVLVQTISTKGAATIESSICNQATSPDHLVGSMEMELGLSVEMVTKP